MKKQIQTKKVDAQVYSTIKKLSLSMTIIGWVIIAIMIVSFAIYGAYSDAQAGTPEEAIKTKAMFTIIVGVVLMVLALFLSIGQIVLSKKVSNVTPKTTGKQSLIVFAVALGLGLLGLVGASVAYALHLSLPLISCVFLSFLAFIMQTITSTIIVAQIKVKKPVKKGK